MAELVIIYTFQCKAMFLMGTKILNYVAEETYNLYITFLENTIVIVQ